MTTPKELAEEFRRLAAEADTHSNWADLCDSRELAEAQIDVGRSEAYRQAAQMVEDKLK